MTAKHSKQLKTAALKAGIVDLDALVLADGSVKDDGSAKAAAELVAGLKAAKPHLFQKMAREMTQGEQAAWWRDHARRFPGGAPPPAPMDMSKKARDMTPAEQEAWWKECARRFG